MKKVSLLIFALILLLVFVACQPTEEACTHEWTAATCTAAKTCTKCNATEGAALGHDWAAATCTAAKTCKNCNETEGSPLGHTEVTLEAKAATCTATGLTEGKKCSVCNTVTKPQTTVPATGHDLVQHAGQEATCTEGGWNAYETCNNCDHNTKVEVNAHGHTEQTLEAVDPTCTETGLTAGKKCTVCGTTTVEQTVVDATGHDSDVNVPGTAPTCGETGLTDGKKCSVCGTTTVEQTVIPATGEHSNLWGEEEGTRQEPTCTEDGYVEYVVICDNCGAVMSSRTEPLVAPGHNVPDATYNNDATCEADGTKTGTCTICNESVTATAEGTALGHKMPVDAVCGEMWTCENGCGVPQGPRQHTMASATCTAPSTCTNCGHTEGDVLPHTPGEAHNENVVAPGCETSGSYDLVTRCTVCNAVTSSESKTSDPTGHNMAPATCDAPSTCENGCGKTEGEKVANHTPTASVENGVITYICTTCSDAFVTEQALVYDGSQTNLSFVPGSGSDIAMKTENGQYNVLAGDGATKSQYMLYLPSNSASKPGMMTGWNAENESFGVFSFRVNLSVALKNEPFRVIVMSARDNPNWDKNGAWSGNSIDILAFMPNFDGDTFNGTYRVYGNSMTSNTFATVNANEWVDVKMFMQINAEGLFTISYYINGEFCNVYTRDLKDPSVSMSIKNLDINCAYICGWTTPGTGFAIDDIYLGYAKHTEWLFDEHKHVWADADCENAKHCTACGLVDESAPALGHTNATKNDKVVAPDCVNPGSHDVVTYCSTCNKEFSRESVVDAATGHDLDENNVCKVCGTDLHECNLVVDEVIAPTCTEGGYTVYKCNHPGCTKHENRDFTEATGHSMQDATCTAPKTCSACGHTEGDAKGHNYAAPTCAVASQCTVCGNVKGTPNADAHNLTSTYANKTLTYSCSVCNYKFVVDTFEYNDGTNYSGVECNASTNNGVYTTNGSNYPVQKDGYLEFIRTEESAGAQKQLQMWLPKASGVTSLAGFNSASNSIGYLAFRLDAKTDVNFEMKLVDHRVDNVDLDGDGTAESIRWSDAWAINEPVFRVMPTEASSGITYLRGFNGVQLAAIKANEDGFTGWVDVAIQIVLDPETDKVIAHYYINGAYVATEFRNLTTHTDAIQAVYLNFNSKSAGCGYRIDNLTFGYSAHKHDFDATLTNGVLSYNCACGTEFVAATDVRNWDGDGNDSAIKNVPNGNVELSVNAQGQYEYIFKPETDVAPDFSASGTQSGQGWYEYDGKGYAGGQLQMWMPSNNRDTNTFTDFSCENDAVGVISFNVKTNLSRHPDWDTSLTFSVGKPRNASDWNDGGSWADDSINIFTIEEYQASGIVVKGGLNGTNINLGTIPVTEDGWSEWFNVMIVIEMTKEEYINVYYYINGTLCGTDSRDLNNPGGYRTLNPKKIEALQMSGWTYVPNTGIVFDDFYFGYTSNGHNTLDGHVHKLTETTCGEKSTCSCGWTGYTVAHTFASACAPACSVCGLANEHAATHTNLVPTAVSDGVAYVCSDCNYSYTVKSTNGHNLGDISDLSVRTEYERTYDGTSFKLINLGTANAQHQFWIPGQTESPKFAECSNANESTVFLSFSINAKDHHNTGIEFKVNANRGTSQWETSTGAGDGWSKSSVGVFKIKPTTADATTVALGGYNGADLGSIAITGENGWTGWIDVVVVMHLNKDNTITVEYYINGSLFKTLHADFVIWTYEINSLYVNGRTNEGQGFELKNFFFGYTNEDATEYKAPFYKSEIAKEDVTNEILKSVATNKIKQWDQSDAHNVHTGTPVFVVADKDGQDVQGLYFSRTTPWVGDEKEQFSEFRVSTDGSKKATSISFDYKIDGTVETNDRYTFTDLNGNKFSADAYVQIKTPSAHPLAGDDYPELSGTDLILDGEWHTMTYTFETPLEIINILFNLYHFQGELIIANLEVEYEAEPFYKEVIAADDVTNEILKSVATNKIKQWDQSDAHNVHTGTPVFVVADKDGQDVQGLYFSRTTPWVGDEKEQFSEFRVSTDGSKKATSISFDYKIDGTVETNDRYTFTDLNGNKFSADAYVQIKTPSAHPLAGDDYPELSGTDLILDGEWHTMTYTFETPLEIINILFNLYHFQGELVISNLVVTYE